MNNYQRKLLDPRWQRRRLEIMSKANFSCEECCSESETLHVHHSHYEKGKEPWEYEDDYLFCLCSDCHKKFEKDRTLLLKAISLSSKSMMRPGFLMEELIKILESTISSKSGDLLPEQIISACLRTSKHADIIQTVYSREWEESK